MFVTSCYDTVAFVKNLLRADDIKLARTTFASLSASLIWSGLGCGFILNSVFLIMRLIFFQAVPEVNQIFTVLFKTSMVVGGMCALILDNILPGSVKDRGIIKWRSLMMEQRKGNMASIHVYDLPFGLTSKFRFTKYIPFLPYYPEDSEVGENRRADDPEIHYLQQQQTHL